MEKKLTLPWGSELKAEFEYDSEGRMLSTKYPQGGRMYLKYNASDRPNELWKTMTAPALDELQASVGYDQRGLMTSMSRPDGWQQGWSYSEGGLMTGHSVASVNVSYTYETATPVTGKLQTMTQNGNTVTYGYDALGRLSSGTSAAWNESYTYDGFSNLLQKTGSTGTQNWSGTLNSEKNQIGQYDAAGNALGYTWDADNRLQYVAPSKYYLYDSSNQRVVDFTDGQNSDTAVVTLRAGGMMLGRYTYDVNVTATLTTWQEFKYLGGRRTDVGSDRLGSDVTGNRTLLPYGEELTPTANGATKFATYWRDADTGLDYADQRYHSPGVGRFLSADPYQARVRGPLIHLLGIGTPMSRGIR